MAMRLSGLMSGMDTESIIEQLVMAKRTKLDNTKKAQKKLEWKQDAWKTLNSKIKKLYDGMLSNLRFEGSYMKKTTKVSNSSVVSVITGANAMNSVQSLKVSQMAQSAYLTGGKIDAGEKLTSDSRLSKLGWDFFDKCPIKVTVGGEEKEIMVTGATTIGELVQSFNDAGVNASFDATNQRFYIAAKNAGTENDFTITAGDVNGQAMLASLGLSYVDDAVLKPYQTIADQDVEKTVESRLQGRLDSRLAYVTSTKAEFINARDELTSKVNGLKSKYADKLDGASTPDQIKEKIAELFESDTLSDDEKADLSELKSGLIDLDAIEVSLADIESRLTTDEEGNVVLTDDEKQAEKDKLQKDVEYEIASAKETINRLKSDAEATGAVKNAATDAIIELNGVEYTNSTNTFEINGLTLTINSTTGKDETVTITTQDDTDGIYDMIKNFLKEYNELINEMDKLYNADSARGYEPLTDEEKEAMSDTEIEEWEKKIKESLLRRDDTLGSVSNALKSLMMGGVSVNGKQMYLSDFGIETLSYFTAAENEKNAYHINGDPDDSSTSANEDKLRAMIASDPQTVVDFFVGLSRDMYSKMTDLMAHTDYSSSYTVYEDVKMKAEYDGYTSKIKELEKKLADYEDKWYQKFAKMETAMSKMQNSMSAVTSLLGG